MAVKALFKDLVLFPKLLHCFFSIHKIHISGYFLVLAHSVYLPNRPTFDTENKNAFALQTGRKRVLRFNHPLLHTNICAFDNGEIPAQLSRFLFQPATLEGYSAKSDSCRASTLPSSLYLLLKAYCLCQRLLYSYSITHLFQKVNEKLVFTFFSKKMVFLLCEESAQTIGHMLFNFN